MSCDVSLFLVRLFGSGLALSLEPAGTRLRGGMKVGRGHVCNINPILPGADQSLVGTPHHVAIGPRTISHRGGSDTLVMTIITPSYSTLCIMFSSFMFSSNFSPSLRTLTHLLRQAALGRTSALLAAQKEPKPTPERKARGKKALAIEESA